MTKSSIFVFTAISLLLASNAFGFTTTVAQTSGPNSDGFANGNIVGPQGVSMATWNLTTTTRTTDFENDAVQGGTDGLQYVMINTVENSTDFNAVRFFVDPIDPTDEVQITISQSPYTNSDTWNGGEIESSEFFLTWTGIAGSARVHDPLNQLNVVDGQTYTSPLQVSFNSNRARNDEDQWLIELPPNANIAETRWVSTAPQVGSSLTREWITFAADVTSSVVPEPSASVLMAIASLMLMGFSRKAG